MSCLAAPIFGAHGRPVAAISISAPPQRMNVRAMEPVLRRVAGTASRALARSRSAQIGLRWHGLRSAAPDPDPCRPG